MSRTFNRRDALKLIGGSALLAALPGTLVSGTLMRSQALSGDFIHCLNMSTIRGQNLGFVKELETAAQAGFRSVEIWMATLQAYLEKGGTLQEANRIIGDLGLTVEDAIAFAPWIVDDTVTRTRGVEQMKREMDMVAQIGCRRIAAPPSGATQQAGLDLDKAAQRYRNILELGEQTGVTPHLEIWGHSRNLHRLSQALYVATESGHPRAHILLDVFHLYKGGSAIETLKLTAPSTVEILHMNDYPELPRESITDGDRVYPGDGIAPIRTILETLRTPDRPLVLSLEVFNKEYWAQDALAVCRTGLARMKAVAGS